MLLSVRLEFGVCFWYGEVAWEINRLLVDAFLGLWDSRTTIYDGTVVSCLQYSMLHCLLHLLADDVLGVDGGHQYRPGKDGDDDKQNICSSPWFYTEKKYFFD